MKHAELFFSKYIPNVDIKFFNHMSSKKVQVQMFGVKFNCYCELTLCVCEEKNEESESRHNHACVCSE